MLGQAQVLMSKSDQMWARLMLLFSSEAGRGQGSGSY